MLDTILMMLESQQAVETTPKFSSPVVASSLHTGTCSGSTLLVSGAVRVDWTLTGFNSSTHQINIYQDGVLLAADIPNAEYPYVVSGRVSNGSRQPIFYSWVFRVDVLRRSDSAVLTSGSSTWSAYYYTC